MADKENKSSETEKSGGNKKLIIIIAAVLIILIGGGVAAYLLLLKAPPPEEEEPATEQAAMINPDEIDPSVIGPMIDLQEFVVNIISEDGTHFLRTALTLELTNDIVLEEATQRMPQIRNAVLLLITNKTFEELRDLHGKKQVTAEIKSKINSFLTTGQVRNVFLTDFVIQ